MKRTHDEDAVPSIDQNTQFAEQINVQPTSNDTAIDTRFTNILEAKGWFSDTSV